MSNNNKGGSPTPEAVLAMTKRPGGFATKDMPEFAASRVGAIAWKLIQNGLIYRGKLSHKIVRFFGTEKEATDWEDKHRRPSDRIALTIKARSRAGWNADTPPYFPTNPDGSPAYKVTVAVPPPQRVVDGLTGLRFTSFATPSRVMREQP